MDRIKFSFEKSLFLAALPFFGYITAYNYEKGYLSFFNIPSLLIRLSLEDVIVATSVLVSGLFVFYYLFLTIIALFWKLINKSERGRTLKITLILFFIASPYIFIFNNITLLDKLIIALAMLLYLLFYEFGLPIIFQKGTLEERLVKENRAHEKATIVENYIFSKPKLKLFYLAILTLFYTSGLAFFAGVRDAGKQTDYLVFSDKDTYAVVRNYSDRIIVVKIDDKLKSLKENVRIISFTDNLNLRHETIGPLQKNEKKSLSTSLYSLIGNTISQVTNLLNSIFINARHTIIRK